MGEKIKEGWEGDKKEGRKGGNVGGVKGGGGGGGRRHTLMTEVGECSSWQTMKLEGSEGTLY